MKNKFKCSDISFMHDHTLHGTLHMFFLSETGMQSEKVCAPDKSFKKIFSEKKEIFNKIRVFKEAQIPTERNVKSLLAGTRR